MCPALDRLPLLRLAELQPDSVVRQTVAVEIGAEHARIRRGRLATVGVDVGGVDDAEISARAAVTSTARPETLTATTRVFSGPIRRGAA
jgi:hypothetical protein